MCAQHLSHLINLDKYPIDRADFIQSTKHALDEKGVVCLDNFLMQDALSTMVKSALDAQHLAYYTQSTHNVYLTPNDTSLPADHVFNRQITSSKGCITTDQVAHSSGLHDIYSDKTFKHFIAHVVGEDAIYPYADPLSGINIHYASEGQELGWHFDNSSFAITLLLQAPDAGGQFEYCRDIRDADNGEMNFDGVDAILKGEIKAEVLDMKPGSLVLFRGRNSLHRVTPTRGTTTRFLVVLAYNNQPGISLSESARMTFYGRLGTEAISIT